MAMTVETMLQRMRNYCVIMAVLLFMGGFFSVVKADDRRGVTNQFNDASIHAVNIRQNSTLSEYIWNGAVDLLPQAWSTTFVAGVANGSMDPNFYGNYVLQDATYCRLVAQLWTQLANNASVNAEIRQYAGNSSSGFQDCSTALFGTWNVKDDGANNYGVIVREPVMEYVTFINNTMIANPANTLIATYACLQLWNNLTAGLYSIVQNSTNNPYDVWVYENVGNSSALRQAAQMDEWDQNYPLWYNWSEALSLFRTAVLHEINFFDHAGNVSTSLGLNRLQQSKALLSYDKKHESM